MRRGIESGGILLRLLVALVLVIFVAALLSGSFFMGNGAPPFVVFLVCAFLIGLTGYYVKSAPWLLTGLVVLAYLAWVGWMAVDVVGCPRCDHHDGFDRLDWFTIWAMLYGFFAAAIVVVTAAGALTAFWLRGLQAE